MMNAETGLVIYGINGTVRDAHFVHEVRAETRSDDESDAATDIDLKRMAGWAMNYLIHTPRADLDYEPVFQCHPLKCPPTPQGHDVVAPCDTDARMNWEWYYMREVSGSTAGLVEEAGFHRRMLSYVQDDGAVLCHPGCYNEADINRVYTKDEHVYHIWGATKILHALAEDYRRTGNVESKATARKIMLWLKHLAIFPTPAMCYLPAGMGALRQDGSPIPNYWNKTPAPLVEPLVNVYLATGDAEALDFARAYAEGIMAGIQPDGIKIGQVTPGDFGGGHGHATLHALWGVAHLGAITGEGRYTQFAKSSLDWMLAQGTGAGWFPAAPDWATNCSETCCLSDIMSIAALVARAGYPEYFDYVERFLRNSISNLQFIVTPAFEEYYRSLNHASGSEAIARGLDELRKFQGGIIGGSGLNDIENTLLGRVSGYEMFGCCAPEGMRAIYTTWTNVIDRLPQSPLGPAGVYVNMCLSRESPWGRVISHFPNAGGMTVEAAVSDSYFLRPPHWAPRNQVRATVGARSIPVQWSGAYVRFDGVAPGDRLTIHYPLIGFTQDVEGAWRKHVPDLHLIYTWIGNMVVSADPVGVTPLFTGQPRVLPEMGGEEAG